MESDNLRSQHLSCSGAVRLTKRILLAVKSSMKNRILICTTLLICMLFQTRPAYSCSWAIGYFHQVTKLRGSVVGSMNPWLPRLVQQRVPRGGVKLNLYEYRWPLHEQSEMPLVKKVTTDRDGRFDFGNLNEGHYTLVIDWPSESANWFDVEIKRFSKETSFVKIDVSACASRLHRGSRVHRQLKSYFREISISPAISR
jgi:hypothetical protein